MIYNYHNSYHHSSNDSFNDHVSQPSQQSDIQKQLYNESIRLNYNLVQHNNESYFIKINKLPIIHKKDVFKPFAREVFFVNENGLNCQNSYRPSVYMINTVNSFNTDNSFILQYLFFMANQNIEQAINIIRWLINGFLLEKKLDYALILHSEDDLLMKLFYEEIILPLFNSDYCEQIENDDLNSKALCSSLDEKIIYNFHNITMPNILGIPSKEFTKRLLYKDDLKINSKTVSTQGHILITATTAYIPLIAEDVPSILVNVGSSLDDLCNMMHIKKDPYIVAAHIKNDLENFAAIARCINLDKLDSLYGYKYYNGHKNVLDGDFSLIEVFYRAIKEKDIVFFLLLKTKAPKLYQTLIKDFEYNRVNRKNLVEYFITLFGEEIYTRKNYRTFIADLKMFSSTKEPFENERTFQIQDQVYYRL